MYRPLHGCAASIQLYRKEQRESEIKKKNVRTCAKDLAEGGEVVYQ
jgi:hypothetical protein